MSFCHKYEDVPKINHEVALSIDLFSPSSYTGLTFKLLFQFLHGGFELSLASY